MESSQKIGVLTEIDYGVKLNVILLGTVTPKITLSKNENEQVIISLILDFIVTYCAINESACNSQIREQMSGPEILI